MRYAEASYFYGHSPDHNSLIRVNCDGGAPYQTDVFINGRFNGIEISYIPFGVNGEYGYEIIRATTKNGTTTTDTSRYIDDSFYTIASDDSGVREWQSDIKISVYGNRDGLKVDTHQLSYPVISLINATEPSYMTAGATTTGLFTEDRHSSIICNEWIQPSMDGYTSAADPNTYPQYNTGIHIAPEYDGVIYNGTEVLVHFMYE